MRTYIASPLRANYGWSIVQHQAFARLAMAHAMAKGMTPFVPHLLYPQVLDPAEPEQDALGISMSNAMLLGSQALWAYLPHRERAVSAGMQAELAMWAKNAENPTARLWLPTEALQEAIKLALAHHSLLCFSPHLRWSAFSGFILIMLEKHGAGSPFVSIGKSDAIQIEECFQPATLLVREGEYFFQPMAKAVGDA